MEKKLILLLLLVLGLVSVACQQDVLAQVPVDEVVIAAAIPQEVVETVAVVSVDKPLLMKSGPKLDVAVQVKGETAVSTEIAEKAIIPLQEDDTVVHTVQEGEWVFEIARCYGTTPQAIIHANFYYYYHDYYYYDHHYYPYYYYVGNPNYIVPGQELIIPGVGSNGEPYGGPECVRKHEDTYQHTDGRPGTYIHEVEQGDWVYELARCYGTEPKHIIRANALYHPDYIKPGMLLVIPLAGSIDDVDGPDCIDYVSVGEGDTWESLAEEYNTTVEILKLANPGRLKDQSRIWVPVH